IVMLDGDKMGEHLRNADRAQQRSISDLLSRFALDEARVIVERCHGVLIYSGGDDVLAMLPVSQALACAKELHDSFRNLWKETGTDREAFVSAGIAVMHLKEDLRFALDTTRRAEKQAKDSGRNCLALTVCRRSGEHTHVTMPWSFAADDMQTLVTAFTESASDRWVYHLMRDRETVMGLPAPAGPRLEIRRQLKRSDLQTRLKLPVDVVLQAFDRYCDFRREPARWPASPAFYRKNAAEQQQVLGSKAFEEFVALCQSASFLARGRDSQ
ncbi:MAG: type III-B CRISPR-associated protein Cas10/Cmr2, partial [Planctomycetaceae bacterium]|nr:type III-B CRISPR-associated protein Cas10/Cmr2 [Planctomycetaceae bacterium]